MCTSSKTIYEKGQTKLKVEETTSFLQVTIAKLKERERDITVLLVCGDLFAAGDRTKDDSNGGSMTKLTRDDNHTATELTENINHKAIELKENMNLQLQ